MSPHPIWSHLDYCGGGEGFYEFTPLEKESLAIYLGETKTPSFYARIDPIRRRLNYENLGSEPALLVRQNSARVFHLTNEGSLRIEPGDVMAAFAGAIEEEAVVRAIRDYPGGRAAAVVSRVLDTTRGTIVAVRFIAIEEPALAEESADLTLAVA